MTKGRGVSLVRGVRKDPNLHDVIYAWSPDINYFELFRWGAGVSTTDLSGIQATGDCPFFRHVHYSDHKGRTVKCF